MKINREEVYDKGNGRCAYCGEKIGFKNMQVDHIIPKRNYSEIHKCLIVDGRKFEEYELNDIQNLNPSCRICNNWKTAMDLEEFRTEIEMQVERARKYSRNFRMAEKYNLVIPNEKSVVFYFETL